MSRRRRFSTQLVGVGGSRPWEPDPEPSTSEPGRTFLANATDIAHELEQARAALVDVEAPPGFTPLPVSVVVAIVHTLQSKRCSLDHPGEVYPLAFRATGDFLCGVGALDTLWLEVGQEVDRSKVLTIDLHGLPSPVARGQYRRPTLDDVHALALDDARELASWYADATGRTWRADTPHPDPIPAPVLVALSAPAKRNIMRHVRERVERGALPLSVRAAAPSLVFDPLTGECFGSGYPLDSEHMGRAEATYLRCRAVDDDPATLEFLAEQLDRVRVEEPGGKVVVLDPAQV